LLYYKRNRPFDGYADCHINTARCLPHRASILNATHREGGTLVDGVLVHAVVFVVHIPVVSVIVGDLRSRPPIAVVDDSDERAKAGVPESAGQGRKLKIIRPITVIVPTAF